MPIRLARVLRSKSRCAAGRFSSSTNIEPLEWLVFDNHIRDGNGFANGLLGDPAIPLPHDFLPCQASIELFQDNPHHDACSLERRLAAANLRIGNNMAPQFDSPAGCTCLRFHVDAPHYAPAQSAVVSAPLQRIKEPFLLGSLHAHRPVELKVMVLARATIPQLPEPLISASVIA